MSAYLLRRGARARNRRARAHLARYDALGNITGSWCGFSGYDMSSNVPWGLRTCLHCLRLSSQAVSDDRS